MTDKRIFECRKCGKIKSFEEASYIREIELYMGAGVGGEEEKEYQVERPKLLCALCWKELFGNDFS